MLFAFFTINKTTNQPQWWLYSSLISLGVLHLGLIWKTTANIDQITTESLFWIVIIWLIGQKSTKYTYDYNFVSSFLGLFLLGVILFKTITLWQFEFIFIFCFPAFSIISILLIAFGFQGIGKYQQELLLSWFLFFPTEAIGHWLEQIFKITVIHAKIATYLLYYLGFNTASNHNQVMLYLPGSGEIKAVVGLSCTGILIIVLTLKLALLLISCVNFSSHKKKLILFFSISLGLTFGIIRVMILTLLIPHPSQFDYWHGTEGGQIFSTLAMMIFAGFCYWILSQNQRSLPGKSS